MPNLDDYRYVDAGGWRLYELADRSGAALREQVLDAVRAQRPARHPQTIELSCTVNGAAQHFYLKVFHRSTALGAVKNLARWRGAGRFWRQGLALSAAGFKAPLTVVLGIERGWGFVKRDFVLTEKLSGAPLPLFLRDHVGGDAQRLMAKRRAIRELAQLIRRFHQRGFVHGDLVASNIFLSPSGAANVDFYFMDNDRTRRYWPRLGRTLRRRNLIQLNRMPLAGISLQDRMRFLHGYLNVARLSDGDRKFARWLELRTRRRRYECDGADPTGSFRKLMRWTPPITSVRDV